MLCSCLLLINWRSILWALLGTVLRREVICTLVSLLALHLGLLISLRDKVIMFDAVIFGKALTLPLLELLLCLLVSLIHVLRLFLDLLSLTPF